MDNLSSDSKIFSSVRALLAESIDYAGLFPPSAVAMSEAVLNYATYKNSNYNWMLGRFVVSVARLDEFLQNAGDFVSRDENSVWRLSVLSGEDINDTLRRIEYFNSTSGPGVIVDSIEVKANTISKIDNTVAALPAGMNAYFELGLGENFAELVAQLAVHKQFAKIRTGGVTPEDFPGTRNIIKFVQTCFEADVPFKATAGLHHPIRCFRPLTYEENAAEGTMHGFLNLFLMTGFIREGFRETVLEHVMEEEYAEVFRFDDQTATWRDEFKLNVRQIERLRASGIHSFGSCSFDEPIIDLQKLGIL